MDLSARPEPLLRFVGNYCETTPQPIDNDILSNYLAPEDQFIEIDEIRCRHRESFVRVSLGKIDNEVDRFSPLLRPDRKIVSVMDDEAHREAGNVSRERQ